MDELQDVLGENGKKTGECKTKAEIFALGAWRQVVHALVVVPSTKQVLVQKRVAGRGAFDSLWDVSMGGGVGAGENISDACSRELDEELGLRVDVSELTHIGQYKIPKFIPERGQWSNEFSDVYVLLREVNIDELKLQDSEVADAKLISHDAFERETTDPETADVWVPHGAEFYRSICLRAKELL